MQVDKNAQKYLQAIKEALKRMSIFNQIAFGIFTIRL
jgi:hypothetical protein